MNPEINPEESWEQRTARTKREIEDKNATQAVAKERLKKFEATAEDNAEAAASKQHNEETVLDRIEALDAEEWDPAETIVRDQLALDYEDVIDQLMGLNKNDIAEQVLSPQDLATYKAYLNPKMREDSIALTMKHLKETAANLDDLEPTQIKDALREYVFSQADRN